MAIAAAPGCTRLSGDDAPERVVFEALKALNWKGISERVGRPFPNVADACSHAMLRGDHHEWVDAAATTLILRGDILWQAMCAEWAKNMPPPEAIKMTQPVEDALIGVSPETKAAVSSSSGIPGSVATAAVRAKKSKVVSSIEPPPLFAQLTPVPEE